MQVVKEILLYLDNVKMLLIRKYFIKTCCALFEILFTFVIGIIIETIFYDNNKKNFCYCLVLYIFLFCIRYILCKYLLEINICFQREIQINLRKRLYDKIISSRSDILRNQNTGDLLQVQIEDVEKIYDCLDKSIENLVVALTQISGIFVIIFIYNSYLAVICFFVICFLVLMTGYSKKKFQKARKEFRSKSAEYIEWMNECLKGMRDIRINQAEKNFKKIFEYKTQCNLKNKEIIRFIEIKSERLTGFGTVICIVLLWLCSAVMIIQGLLTVGNFYVINKYFHYIIKNFELIEQALINIKNGKPSFQKVIACLNFEEEDFEEGKEFIRKDVVQELKFENVTFSYDNKKNILAELNGNFKSGKMIVVVGENAVGKTTLLNLIMRIYLIEQGHITYNGEDIVEYYLEDWRNKIAYVQQNSTIYRGTLKDNMLLYSSTITDDEIYKLLKIVDMYDEVMHWENKLDTNLLEGKRLSEGQKQRVAIMRALAKDSLIMLMDEPTATLDLATEKKVILNTKKLCREKILIIVTHKISVSKYADEIIVLKDGKIIKNGTHKSLMKECKYYKKIFDLC